MNTHELDYIEMSDNKVIQFVASQIDSLTKNQKAKVFTEALILGDLAKNPSGLRSKFKQNSKVLNSYFEEVDFNKLAQRIGEDHIEQALEKTALGFVKKNWIPFTVGTVVGIGIITIVKRNK